MIGAPTNDRCIIFRRDFISIELLQGKKTKKHIVKSSYWKKREKVDGNGADLSNLTISQYTYK